MDKAPPDLFDLPPREAEEYDAIHVSYDRQIVLVLASVAAFGAALVCGFPVPAQIWFPAAVAACVWFARTPAAKRILWTVVWAAFAAQLTSAFVSPFTWPLRFGFFAVMIGYFMGYVALRERDQV